ncbi:MAG TPA: dihydrolipoamide acetyltransferase family protein [Jiangellaceae bacterium]|nr:dihydrolipoamide acetyltransferase family protein [Jiangellaceae bacterium]
MTPTNRVFALPDLGEGLTEAEILAWRVAEGDEVAVDNIVVEVETAKAAVEVPCPFSGRVVTLHGGVGDVVAVGQPLLTVADAAEPGSGAVLVGYGTEHHQGRQRHTASARQGHAAPKVISPVVRKLARDSGLDVAALAGSGPAGVVLRRDVEAALVPHDHVDFATVDTGKVDMITGTEEASAVRIPLRGVRRAVAEKLARSRRDIPDATAWVDADATRLLEARDALREANPGRPVGILALLVRFVVAGLRRYPELNARVDSGEIVQFGHVNLGFAAQTERGLIVPVVRSAHRRTTLELAAEIDRLTSLARAGALDPTDLTGGTITVNNYGVFGVDGSTPIINYPEAALIGLGRIVDKPWVVDGELAVRKVTQISLTFDHRVCDGGTAGGFLRYIADCVEQPVGLLADV